MWLISYRLYKKLLNKSTNECITKPNDLSTWRVSLAKLIFNSVWMLLGLAFWACLPALIVDITLIYWVFHFLLEWWVMLKTSGKSMFRVLDHYLKPVYKTQTSTHNTLITKVSVLGRLGHSVKVVNKIMALVRTIFSLRHPMARVGSTQAQLLRFLITFFVASSWFLILVGKSLGHAWSHRRCSKAQTTEKS